MPDDNTQTKPTGGLVIDDQTAAAIASGAPLASVLPGATPKADAQGDSAEPSKEPPAADAQTVDPDPGDGDGDGDQEPEPAAAMTPFQEAMVSVQSQVVMAQETLVNTRVELGQVTAERDALKSAQSGLIDIARAATNKLQVALGGPAMDLSNMPADAVTTQYRALETKFHERFPVGGVAKVPNADDDKGDANNAPNPAQLKAVRLRPVAS